VAVALRRQYGSGSQLGGGGVSLKEAQFLAVAAVRLEVRWQGGGGGGINGALAAAAWRMLLIILIVTMTTMIDY
jgi:hypothetical protein